MHIYIYTHIFLKIYFRLFQCIHATKFPVANLSFIDHFCCIITSVSKGKVHESHPDNTHVVIYLNRVLSLHGSEKAVLKSHSFIFPELALRMCGATSKKVCQRIPEELKTGSYCVPSCCFDESFDQHWSAQNYGAMTWLHVALNI